MFLYPERSEGLARGWKASDLVILAPCGCERNGTLVRRERRGYGGRRGARGD